MRGKFAEFFLGLALGFLGVGTTALAGDPRETGLASVLMESTDPEVLISETPDVETGKIETEMGSFQEVFSTKTLPRKGSQIQLRVPVQDGTNSLILEIQEIHNRRPEAFGYTVLVTGKEVYFRTYQELGAGPNHYFVEVPKELLKGHSPLEITLRHDGGGPFSIGKIWVYEDFFEKVAKPEQVFRPMGIIFPTSSIRLEGESESNRRQGEGVELQRIQKMQDAYSGFQDYGPCGFLNFAGGYGHIDPEEGRKGLLSEIGLSSETGMPGLWIVNGTGWGGKPTGADGRGGYFSDIQYTHSTYDPALGTYRASWPNMWGNTPGAALRNPVMNAFLEKRFQQLTEGIQEQLATLRLKGKTAQPMIVREFAPASGEISQAVIEAAARDGVTLDPTDGMSFEGCRSHLAGIRRQLAAKHRAGHCNCGSRQAPAARGAIFPKSLRAPGFPHRQAHERSALGRWSAWHGRWTLEQRGNGRGSELPRHCDV
jgi:hypothetical protein